MPFYFRRSISAGPFRFNLSQSGVGMSVGVRGLRVGTGPRGHYIRAGVGGFYYQQSLGGGSRRRRSAQHFRPSSPSPFEDTVRQSRHYRRDDSVAMIDIESADVAQMRDESSADLLDDINQTRRRIPLTPSIAIPFAGGTWAASALELPASAVGTMAALGVAGYLFGRVIDRNRRRSVLMYDLDEAFSKRYGDMTAAFDELARCDRRWHIPSMGRVIGNTQWKRNSGASALITRKPLDMGYRLPKGIKSNITPPFIRAGRQTLFIFPDVLLVQDGSSFGAVSHAALTVTPARSNFVETERVPSDAIVVGHTWKYPNRNGGPDRRFAGNRQIPLCAYGSVSFTGHGVLEAFQFSQLAPAFDFATAMMKLRPDVSQELIDEFESEHSAP